MNSSSRSPLVQSLTPLLVEAGVPMAAYYALKAGGLSTFAALAISSVLPAVRTVLGCGSGNGASTGSPR